MSTPSPVPLDNFDPVSPYAPKWAREQGPDTPAATTSEPPSEAQHPAGIETAHDARILDEIEASLRAMITANHGGEEPARLADVSRIAGEQIAQEEEPSASETQPDGAHGEQPPAEMPVAESQRNDHQGDGAETPSIYRDPRTPPWLLPRSLEPAPIPEPWPRPRKRSRSNTLFLRFGLAATGAAVVTAVVVKDIPSLIMEKIRGPMADISTNAAAVFNEGKASPLQTRMDAVQKEQERPPEAGLRYAVANADPASQARSVPAVTEPVRAPEPRKETVMTPWPTPEATKRTEPAPWQTPLARPQMQTQPQAPAPAVAAPATPAVAAPAAPAVAAPAKNTATNAAAARTLSAEEIAMLRKLGDDYISAGDFAGARTVLERAADAGDASAAFAIASTYDPVVLARFKVRGLEPDIVKAGFWYERARELGSAEAPRRLQAMMAARGN